MKSILALATAMTVCVLAASGCCQVASHGDKIIITLVTDTSGIGDKGFNEIGWRGLQRARDELGVIIKKIESSDPANYIKNIATAARYSDLTVANGFLLFDAMTEVSGLYPDEKFVFIDGHVRDRPNVASYTFRSEEVGFLAGILGAGMSKTHRLGVLKGMNIPSVETFDIGYRTGVRCADATWGTTTDVKSLTAGNFNDPQKGNAITHQFINDNRDIIFQLAGATALGGFNAIRDSRKPTFLIGVDLDQDDEIPGKVLTSALKRIDVVVFDVIRDLTEGKFKGGHHSMGIAEGALSFTDMRHTREIIPDRIHMAISYARGLIMAGKISLPQSYDEVETFKPLVLKK